MNALIVFLDVLQLCHGKGLESIWLRHSIHRHHHRTKEISATVQFEDVGIGVSWEFMPFRLEDENMQSESSQLRDDFKRSSIHSTRFDDQTHRKQGGS